MTAGIAIGDDAALAARVAGYLTAQTGAAVQVLALRRFPVGFSWLTYGVTLRGLPGAAEQELILRLGPDFGLFAPYSAYPQVWAMQALEGSAVPVPRVGWHSDDPSVLGAPFLFCEKVPGAAVVPWVSPTAPPLEDGYRQALATQFIDALAALHRVPWQGRPVAQLTPGITVDNAARLTVDHLESQIRRWALRPFPLADYGLRWLKQHAPVAPHVAIVHGDYRTGNFLEEGGRITAILDWELVHLGDPHEDLGWASLPMYRGGSPYICRLAEPDVFYRRYGERVGFEVSMTSVHYYQVFNLLKLAATHMAAARCFEEGRFNDMRIAGHGQPDSHLPAPDGQGHRPGSRGMNNSFERLIDGMCATLRQEVLTRLEDEFARGQVYGVINLLNTFKVRADWSAAFLLQQLAAQRQALARAGELAAGQPGLPAALPADLPMATPIADLLAARDDGNRRLADWLAWLDGPGATLPPALTDQLLQALRAALRAEVDIELQYASRPMFCRDVGRCRRLRLAALRSVGGLAPAGTGSSPCRRRTR